jgi:hypothetical protein
VPESLDDVRRQLAIANRILGNEGVIDAFGRKLKACSCRCNDSVKTHFDVVLRGVYPDAGK